MQGEKNIKLNLYFASIVSRTRTILRQRTTIIFLRQVTGSSLLWELSIIT